MRRAQRRERLRKRGVRGGSWLCERSPNHQQQLEQLEGLGHSGPEGGRGITLEQRLHNRKEWSRPGKTLRQQRHRHF